MVFGSFPKSGGLNIDPKQKESCYKDPPYTTHLACPDRGDVGEPMTLPNAGVAVGASDPPALAVEIKGIHL